MNLNQLISPNQCETSMGSQPPFPKGCRGARAVSSGPTSKGWGHQVLRAAAGCPLLSASGGLDKPRDDYLFCSTLWTVFGSVGSSVQNLEIIWVQTQSSSMSRGFPRSYHETSPCNIPSEDCYDIYIWRETEITKFESFYVTKLFLWLEKNCIFKSTITWIFFKHSVRDKCPA